MKSYLRLFKVILFFLILPVVAQSQASTPADITIDCSGVFLKGKFYVAEGEGIFPTVILLQGFPGNEKDVLGIGNRLSQSGINALTFNYSGTYQSQGLASFENNQKDIQAAFDFIYQPVNINKYKIDTSLIYLGGWCHGGGMSLVYAASHPEITTVFSIAGNDFGEFMREYTCNPEIKKMIDKMFDNMTAPTGPVRFDTGALPKEMAETGIEKINPIFDLRKDAPLLAKKDILLIGGWNDVQVNIDQFVLPLYRALQKENAAKVQITAFQDDHYFRNSREEVAQMVIKWLKKAPERKKNKLTD
jgi:dipeptidyl aminopeptidase/acylaminoacyl peptidase